MEKNMFKKCPTCGFEWNDLDAFIDDPEAELIGYQVNFAHLEEGFLLFNHSCGTTMSCRVGDFWELRGGPVFTECAMGTDECSGACLRPRDLSPCPAQCECVYVRDIMRIIQERKESSVGDSG